jgi:hypothetical protein
MVDDDALARGGTWAGLGRAARAPPCCQRVCPSPPSAPAVAAHCDVHHSYVVSRDERKKNCLVKPMAWLTTPFNY